MPIIYPKIPRRFAFGSVTVSLRRICLVWPVFDNCLDSIWHQAGIPGNRYRADSQATCHRTCALSASRFYKALDEKSSKGLGVDSSHGSFEVCRRTLSSLFRLGPL